MFWRLSPSVRSLIVSNHRRYSSSKTAGPLKILFCGSDDFSIASLRALNDAKRADKQLIESIEVVHRPGKRTGRGLKEIKEVPIKVVASEELSLHTHELDTFTGWTPPSAFDLIIAVSFGLFVPPRILNGMKYGGLNVHPSLLPDLRGPAPVLHTILKGRNKTGVTVHTLHPKTFDHGTILAQTPEPGIDVPAQALTADLTGKLGFLGGEMLVQVLQNRHFVSPLQDAGWYADSGGPIDHAEKITPAHRYVDMSTTTAEDMLAKHRALGNLWTFLPDGERLILHQLQQVPLDPIEEAELGLFFRDGAPFIRTVDGQCVEIGSSTVSGGKKGKANASLMNRLRAQAAAA